VNNPRPEEAIELASDTSLSSREAELYVLHVEEGLSLSEAAEEMGTEKENGRWSRVKEKIREARKTAELEIPGEDQ